MFRIHQHVNSTDVAEAKSLFFGRSDNQGKITAADCRVYVPSKSRLIRISLQHVNVSGQAADDSIGNPSSAKHRMQQAHTTQ
jgi:hypothetical protein